MKIKLEGSIEQFNERFRKIYPGLKLEFYSRAHDAHQGSRAQHQLPGSTDIAKIIKEHSDLSIDISDQITVGELEKSFEEMFGLHVQIYRKSKDLWLQTSSTDDWTLEKQNRKGIHSTQA
jgi:hypothetical protein